LVVTQNGTGVRIYLDGAERAVTGANGAAWTGHLTVTGGMVGEGVWNEMDGAIDEVRLYERALASVEVAEHYQGAFGDDTGLLARWGLNEEVDTQAVSWLAATYSNVSANPNDSLELLQFLPTFLERKVLAD
jgi:hypothetical protein